jgi:hypothetical protein
MRGFFACLMLVPELNSPAPEPYTGWITSFQRPRPMTTTAKALRHWVESASLNYLFTMLKDHSHPARYAALDELGERLTHIALDALLTYHEAGYQPASPLANIGTGLRGSGGSLLNQMELATIHTQNQDKATRLALDLLTWLRPKQTLHVLFAAWVTRRNLHVPVGLSNHWEKAIAELQLTRWFTPEQLKKPTLAALNSSLSRGRKSYTLALLYIADPSHNPAPPKAAGRIARG